MVYEEEFEDLKVEFEKENKLEFHARGKRSFVFKLKYKGKKAVVKVERKDIDAKNRIKNEINWLKKLNKYDIGPELFDYGSDFFIAEFVEGKLFHEWIADVGKEAARLVIEEILGQCRRLDKLKVSKEEMHHPLKHIIVSKKPVMIDFERCHNTEKPQNITQFCQFLLSKRLLPILEKKGFKVDSYKVLEMLKDYKESYSEEDFKELLKALT